ncbi:MAG: BMP family protein [Deltaproteobacteria bacterium]|nr:BMP family protein [Deltaproteobacteria bacterium]MBW2338729.1 BMP family protein [Deltaproteobacteria bacterium]
MARKIKMLSIYLVAFAFVVASVGVSPALGARQLKVAAVMPGTITDGSFNQSCYEGLKVIEKKLGAQIAFSERVSQADQVENIIDYARRGYDLVIAHGGEMDDAAMKVAKKFPKVKFFVTNGNAKGPNVANGSVNPTHYGYVCGVVGAKMTKTNKLACVAGNEFALVVAVYESFKKGVRDYNPDADVGMIYTGSWDDVAKAKEAALAQIAIGVDVLFPVLDLATLGIIEGAREEGVYVFGFSKDQLDAAPKNVLCSAIQNYSAILLHIAKLVKEGKFEGGKSYALGFETPGVTGLGRINKIVPQEVRDLVKKAEGDLISGRIEPYPWP